MLNTQFSIFKEGKFRDKKLQACKPDSVSPTLALA